MDRDRSEQTRRDWNGLSETRTDRNGPEIPGETRTDRRFRERLEQTGTDRERLERIERDQNRLERTGDSGTDWKRM